MEAFQSFGFNRPYNPFLLAACFLIIMGWFWWFTKGLRHFLAKRNYLTLFVIQILLVAGILFLICEPIKKVVISKTQKGSVLVLFDGSKSTHLRGDNPWKLMFQRDNPIESGSQDFDVSYYMFSEELRRLNPKEVAVPEMSEGTEIYTSLEAALKQSNLEDERRVILFSDGQDKVASKQMDSLKLAGVPIYTVGLGEFKGRSGEFRDISLNSLVSVDTLPVSQSAKIKVGITVHGTFKEKKMNVALLVQGEPLEEKQILLQKGKKKYSTSFKWTPTPSEASLYFLSLISRVIFLKAASPFTLSNFEIVSRKRNRE